MSGILVYILIYHDRLCGLVVRVPGYRYSGPGSIPGATRYSEKQWVWNGIHSASWVQLKSCFEEIIAALVQKTEIAAVGIHSADHGTLLYPQKLALTSPTSGDRSVGIVRSRTKATELLLLYHRHNPIDLISSWNIQRVGRYKYILVQYASNF
jgi:hypothetical protein